jgi:3',5'-cyclic AMP phosphodiesterase CpdA
MPKNINRRLFIKESSQAGLSGVLTAGGVNNFILKEEGKDNKTFRFSYNKNKTFKILQLTDTHYVSGDDRSKRAIENINVVMDAEKPDLVIHTGDMIFGEPAERSIREVLEPISERGIPFAVAFGNHDDEYDKTRKELYEIIRTIRNNVLTTTEGITGFSNYVLTVGPQGSKKVDRVLYILDSNAYSGVEGIDGYDHVHFDQINWYRDRSKKFAAENGGNPIPSLAFFHIPMPELKLAAQDDAAFLRGTRGESVCSPSVNSGLFVSMKEMGDIQATFHGHDHNNDFAVYWNNVFMVYGRFSGCDMVYNDLKPNGARITELREGDRTFRSWIRLSDGSIIQDLRYPDDFLKKKES